MKVPESYRPAFYTYFGHPWHMQVIMQDGWRGQFGGGGGEGCFGCFAAPPLRMPALDHDRLVNRRSGWCCEN